MTSQHKNMYKTKSQCNSKTNIYKAQFISKKLRQIFKQADWHKRRMGRCHCTWVPLSVMQSPFNGRRLPRKFYFHIVPKLFAYTYICVHVYIMGLTHLQVYWFCISYSIITKFWLKVKYFMSFPINLYEKILLNLGNS